MNKRVNKSYLVNLKKEIEYGSEVDLSKVWEHHNKKLDVSSLSYIFEPKPQASTLPKSHKSQEIRCEKTNNDKDIINELMKININNPNPDSIIKGISEFFATHEYFVAGGGR